MYCSVIHSEQKKKKYPQRDIDIKNKDSHLIHEKLQVNVMFTNGDGM